MRIVFDMDNCLADEFGKSLRPGIRSLLARLSREGHKLLLFTNSKRIRAQAILRDLGLEGYFQSFVYREDYDPEDQKLPKDVSLIKGEFLVDDSPKEIEAAKRARIPCFQLKAYRHGDPEDKAELERLYKAIRRAMPLKERVGGLWR